MGAVYPAWPGYSPAVAAFPLSPTSSATADVELPNVGLAAGQYGHLLR